MLCCSTTYYCYNFEIYAGKAQNSLTIGDRILYGINDLETLRDLGIGATTVMHNVACLGNLDDGIKRVIFFDRYFTGITLMLFLLRIGIYSCGTVMTNRTKASPVSTGPTALPGNGSTKRGDFRVVPDESGKIMSCVWFDTKLVHFLNTAFRASIFHCFRRSKTNPDVRDKVDCPFLVRMYQLFMRGVDVFDQLRENCCIGRVFKTRRFWLAVFIHLLDTALNNLHILWRMKFGKHNMTKAQFMAHLHAALLEDGPTFWYEKYEKPFLNFHTPSKKTGPGDRGRMSTEDEEGEKRSKVNHLPSTKLGRRLYCVVCFAVLGKGFPITTGCMG